MKNTKYKIFAIAAALFLSVQFFNSSTSETPKRTHLQSQQNTAYSQVRPNQNDSLAGTYQTNNSISGFKDLILDSTYTYAYRVQTTSGEEVILEGSWELSYQGKAPHIILHRPLPNAAWRDLELANIEEHKFRVTPDGLRDLHTQEAYLQLKTDEYSLAVFK